MKKQQQTNQIQGLQSRTEQGGTQRKWSLFIGNECYGFVHASSKAEALDRVTAFKKPFRAVLAAEE